MNKKVQIHQFDPVIYPVKLWIAITKNNKALNERFKWTYKDSDIDIDWNLSDAITGTVTQRENNLFGVLIVFENKKSCTVSNITHESIHAVSDIWERLGESKIGNEANAYLAGWIAECIEKVKRNKF